MQSYQRFVFQIWTCFWSEKVFSRRTFPIVSFFPIVKRHSLSSSCFLSFTTFCSLFLDVNWVKILKLWGNFWKKEVSSCLLESSLVSRTRDDLAFLRIRNGNKMKNYIFVCGELSKKIMAQKQNGGDDAHSLVILCKLRRFSFTSGRNLCAFIISEMWLWIRINFLCSYPTDIFSPFHSYQNYVALLSRWNLSEGWTRGILDRFILIHLRPKYGFISGGEKHCLIFFLK